MGSAGSPLRSIMANRKIEIEKLNGAEDWNRWKWEVKNAFIMYEVSEFVYDTKTCPIISHRNTVSGIKQRNFVK